MSGTMKGRAPRAIPASGPDKRVKQRHGAGDLINKQDLRVIPQQDRAYATCDRLLDAGWAVMQREGMSGATMRAVAEEAHVSLNTAYRYFASIDEIAAEFARRSQARRLSAFAERLAVAKVSVPAELAEVIAGHVVETCVSDDITPSLARQGALRDYHQIAHAELYDMAEMILKALGASGLDVSLPALRGRLFLALAGVAGQALMAALHEPALLESAAFRHDAVRSLSRRILCGFAGGTTPPLGLAAD